MKLIWDGGLIIKTRKKHITPDPENKSLKSDLTLVSHAHIDHTKGLNGRSKMLASVETYEIIRTRTSKKIDRFSELGYKQIYEEDEFKITSYNAGHVLGSRQFMIEDKHQSILFSSDINCVRSLTLDPADQVEADILIIESTYGKPEYALPPREETYLEIAEWCLETLGRGKIPVFSAYSLGKSQELIKLLNQYLKIPIVVDQDIAKISEIYAKSGVNLSFLKAGDEQSKELIDGKGCVLIVSSNRNLSLELKRSDIELAFPSGWALKFKPKSCSASFPLSSHADYYQLIDFVSKCSPKKVYTMHGFCRELAKSINNNLGIRAQPLSNAAQTSLHDF